jgi:hypothetical protein
VTLSLSKSEARIRRNAFLLGDLTGSDIRAGDASVFTLLRFYRRNGGFAIAKSSNFDKWVSNFANLGEKFLF